MRNLTQDQYADLAPIVAAWQDAECQRRAAEIEQGWAEEAIAHIFTKQGRRELEWEGGLRIVLTDGRLRIDRPGARDRVIFDGNGVPHPVADAACDEPSRPCPGHPAQPDDDDLDEAAMFAAIEDTIVASRPRITRRPPATPEPSPFIGALNPEDVPW